MDSSFVLLLYFCTFLLCHPCSLDQLPGCLSLGHLCLQLLPSKLPNSHHIFTVLHDLFLFQDCTKNLNRSSHDNHDSHDHDSQPTGTDQVLMFFVNQCSQFTKGNGHHLVKCGDSLLNQGNKFALHLTQGRLTILCFY